MNKKYVWKPITNDNLKIVNEIIESIKKINLNTYQYNDDNIRELFNILTDAKILLYKKRKEVKQKVYIYASEDSDS